MNKANKIFSRIIDDDRNWEIGTERESLRLTIPHIPEVCRFSKRTHKENEGYYFTSDFSLKAASTKRGKK